MLRLRHSRGHGAALFPLALAGMAFGCGDSLGEPRPVPLPTPDTARPLLTDRPMSPRIANYRIRARLDTETHRITATQELEWTNTGDSPVHALPFHLYLNAFKNETTVFMRESRGEHRSERASEHGWGWIEVGSVAVDGVEHIARARFPGPDETVLEVPLLQPIPPGGRITVEFEFVAQLPEVFARTGYKGAFHMVGQWFPKIGVRVGPAGRETWHCKPFHLASEFFADFGTYDVALTVPQTHVVAATGVLIAADDNDEGTRTLRYRAEDVHDFAWMADPYMQVISETATTELGEVEVRIYHRPGQREFARRHLVAGVGAIEHFSRLFVPYPWPIMSIIDPPPRAAGGAGGMEYPTLVTTAGDSAFMRPGVRLPEFVTVHEVGHNWFQGMLASNEVEEAWLDEGVNEWADGLVMEAIYGDASWIDWHGLRAGGSPLRRAALRELRAFPVPIATPSYGFPDWGSYGSVTYAKTAMALDTLMSITGRERFLAAMQAYARAFQFKHPTGRDLLRTLERELDEELTWFWNPAFHRVGGSDFRVREVSCRAHHEPRGVFGSGDERVEVTEDDAPDTGTQLCEVLVVNVGVVPAPVEVEVEFADGAVERVPWQLGDGARWTRLSFARPSRVARVTIDPDRRVPLNDGLTNSEHRVESSRAASRRGAARVQFWAHGLMQVTGL